MDRCLDIELTRRCNLRCDYCFVGWSRGWSGDLPTDTAAQIIDEGAAHFDMLHLTGGEPFICREIFALIDRGLACGYQEILINTNGTLLDAAMIARLGGYGGRVGLSVSLDGPPQIHDPIRGPGRYAQAAAAIDALLAAGVPVTVMTVVTPAVLAVLPSFLDGLRRAHPGLVGVTLFPVGVGPEGSQRRGVQLSRLHPGQLHELAAVVALAWHAGVNVTVGAYPMINPLLIRLGVPAERLYRCTAGRGRMCVHSDLAVSSCHPVKEPIYGRWSPGLFSRLHAFRGHAILGARDYDGCRSCSQKEACGHCRAFVTAAGADLYGNDRVCLEVVPGRREELAREEAAA